MVCQPGLAKRNPPLCVGMRSPATRSPRSSGATGSGLRPQCGTAAWTAFPGRSTEPRGTRITSDVCTGRESTTLRNCFFVDRRASVVVQSIVTKTLGEGGTRGHGPSEWDQEDGGGRGRGRRGGGGRALGRVEEEAGERVRGRHGGGCRSDARRVRGDGRRAAGCSRRRRRRTFCARSRGRRRSSGSSARGRSSSRGSRSAGSTARPSRTSSSTRRSPSARPSRPAWWPGSREAAEGAIKAYEQGEYKLQVEAVRGELALAQSVLKVAEMKRTQVEGELKRLNALVAEKNGATRSAATLTDFGQRRSTADAAVARCRGTSTASSRSKTCSAP